MAAAAAPGTPVRLVLICAGGAVGTAARYLIGGAVAHWLGPDFPYGTLVINVSGSFLIAVIQEVGLATLLVPDTLRLALTVGVMGGFTTYSSFSYETIKLAEGGAWLPAAVNVVATTALCLIACAAGLEAARALVAWRAGS